MLSKLALALLVAALVSCSVHQRNSCITSAGLNSMLRLKASRMELVDADVLLGEKPAILAQWREAHSRRRWSTYSPLDHPRRILATSVEGGIARKVEVRFSLDESLEFQNRLSEEAALLSAAAPKAYRESMNEEQKKAFWTRHAVGEWLISLKRQAHEQIEGNASER
jgi:hypothetical protein